MQNSHHGRCHEEQVQAEMQLWMGLLLVGIVSWGFLLRQLKKKMQQQSNLKLPPGPPCWPIVGCLPFLPRNVRPPEVLFQRLADKYGDVMLLSMGARQIVVVSSARMAMAFLKLHDQQFANRPAHIAYKHLSWNDTALVPMSSTHPNFKPLRRMFASEIVSPRQVTQAEGVRKEQVVNTVCTMMQELDIGRCVNVTKAINNLAMNLALCLAFGCDYGTKVAGETDTLVHHFQKMMHLLIRSSFGNYGDFIPALQWLDVQGIEAAFREVKGQLRDSIVALILKKEEEVRENGTHERDGIVSKLLSLQGEEHVSKDRLIGIIFTLLITSTDSTYKTITEAIHEVVRNPHIHKRALEELDLVVGTTTRLVEEQDMPQLPFLHNIIKETLRLHPPAPTIPPHLSFEPCEVDGYFIPANCSIIINLLPIMRDASFWDNPLEFNPDRFNDMGTKLTVQGSDFHFIPFGYGKRQCPAINLAMTTTQYVVAVCLQCVAWQVPAWLDRSANVGTTAEPRKRLDVVLEGKLRVDPRLLETNASVT